MAIYLEKPKLDLNFPFRTLYNDGDILTTPHWHKEMEIIYVKTGIIHMGFQNEAFDVKEGEFAFITGGRIHYVLASPGSIRYVYQFNDAFFQDIPENHIKDFSIRKLWSHYPAYSANWTLETSTSVKQLLLSIYKEDQAKMPMYSFAIKGYLCLMMTELHRRKKENAVSEVEEYRIDSNQTWERLDKLFRYVENYYTEEITLEDAAKHLGLSNYYFTRFFKKNTGKTFIEFLNQYRIEKAKWLLLNSDPSTDEVIEQIGIGSSKTYYRLFRQYVHMSPKEYRKQYKPDTE